MNFSEFKNRLGAEPRSQDPEMLQARDSGPEFREAAQEADVLERKLEAALSSVAVPEDLFDRIRAIPLAAEFEDQQRASRAAWWRLGIAAAVVASVSVASVKWYESTFEWESVNDYIVDHWAADGEEFLSMADGLPVDPAEANRLFASFDIEVSPELTEHIDTLHKCRTPDSRGAHMVIITEHGPVTLIFMPKVDAVDGHIIAFGHQVAATLQLERGSAVVIGANEEVIAPVFAMARAGIRPATQTS